MTDRIPHDATVRIHVGSHASALRDLATLLEHTGDAQFTIDSLRSLADRSEEMYRQQMARVDTTPERNRLAHAIAERWRVDPSDPVDDLREQARALNARET